MMIKLTSQDRATNEQDQFEAKARPIIQEVYKDAIRRAKKLIETQDNQIVFGNTD